jgi:hypothetical protein
MRKLIVTLIAALSLTSFPALADRGDRDGRHDYRGHGSAWTGLAVVGALAGLAIMAERSRPVEVVPYYEQPVYSPPVVYDAPPVYAPPPAPDRWYYCRSSAIYYPYTQSCPEGWQAVPARPY